MKFLRSIFRYFWPKKNREEKFLWIGDGLRPLTVNELVGIPYTAEDGEQGVIISNTALTLTVRFN